VAKDLFQDLPRVVLVSILYHSILLHLAHILCLYLVNNNLPRGLQRVQKTQMLDFSAASEIEQNTANAVKKAQDGKYIHYLLNSIIP
jgi:hypothetical protein